MEPINDNPMKPTPPTAPSPRRQSIAIVGTIIVALGMMAGMYIYFENKASTADADHARQIDTLQQEVARLKAQHPTTTTTTDQTAQQTSGNKTVTVHDAPSATPAAGVCGAVDAAATVVVVTLNDDVPSPRCVKVTSTQKLKLVNKRTTTIKAGMYEYTADIAPNGDYTLPLNFGTFLAPGVHRAGMDNFAAEIWLQ